MQVSKQYNGMSAIPRTSISPPFAPRTLSLMGIKWGRLPSLIDWKSLSETSVAVDPLSTRKAALTSKRLQST